MSTARIAVFTFCASIVACNAPTPSKGPADIADSGSNNPAPHAKGLAPISAGLARITAAKSRTDITTFFGSPGFTSTFGVGIGPDLKNPERYALSILHAYHHSLQGKEAPILDAPTGDQRFFLGFAQVRCSKTRDDALRNKVMSDVHSPDYFRVNGTLPNLDTRYAAFNVQPGEKLHVKPEERVVIW
jgi:predicted metalloendopeptidase